MAKKAFNAVDGISVGTPANVVIAANTDITTSNITVSGTSTLGPAGNVKITGGANAQVLTTDGSGNLSWATAASNTTITSDVFTGNGVQTTFLLSVTPNNINQTTVNYNGAILLRTNYSLSGANVVFSSAPASTSQIEVTTTQGVAGSGSTTTDILSPFLLMGA